MIICTLADYVIVMKNRLVVEQSEIANVIGVEHTHHLRCVACNPSAMLEHGAP